jgi:hypothetical protein
MAKITFGPMLSEARGRAADIVFTKTRGGNVARALSLTAATALPHNLLSLTHPDTTAATPPTRGSLLTGQAETTRWQELLLGTVGQVLGSDGTDSIWIEPTTGTVTSVALALPAQFSISGSPVTGAGTLTGAWHTQAINLIFAGPASGAAAAPTFRSLVPSDIPALATTKITSGIFPAAQGGTGNAYTSFAGPATTVKTYTVPNLSGTLALGLGVLDLTAQTAAVGTTTILSSANNLGGLYRISFSAKITTAATTSSLLGGAGSFQVWGMVDLDDAVAVFTPAGLPFNNTAAGLALNTTQVVHSGDLIVNLEAAHSISIRYGYTSSGATPMAFSLHVRTEKL